MRNSKEVKYIITHSYLKRSLTFYCNLEFYSVQMNNTRTS
uniref:Uncharacterized protein n=1 Tax=Anguilla anguilla TaxID=7936 RepID=A0A0E9QZT4_ANGAN